MINDKIKPTGELTITLRDATGNIKVQTTVPNLVTTVGKNLIASRLSGTGTAATHMAIGSGSTAANLTDTILVTEIPASTGITAGRQTLTSTPTTNYVDYACTFEAGRGTGAITEAGILNASTGGVLLCRTVFNSVYKDALDTLTINWRVTIN